jgi:hypothetical protein
MREGECAFRKRRVMTTMKRENKARCRNQRKWSWKWSFMWERRANKAMAQKLAACGGQTAPRTAPDRWFKLATNSRSLQNTNGHFKMAPLPKRTSHCKDDQRTRCTPWLAIETRSSDSIAATWLVLTARAQSFKVSHAPNVSVQIQTWRVQPTQKAPLLLEYNVRTAPWQKRRCTDRVGQHQGWQCAHHFCCLTSRGRRNDKHDGKLHGNSSGRS